MTAYHRVYDSRHLQADCQDRTGISSGNLHSVIDYGLPFYTTDSVLNHKVTYCIPVQQYTIHLANHESDSQTNVQSPCKTAVKYEDWANHINTLRKQQTGSYISTHKNDLSRVKNYLQQTMNGFCTQ